MNAMDIQEKAQIVDNIPVVYEFEDVSLSSYQAYRPKERLNLRLN